MSAKVPVVKLNNNLDYPIIGLGTWKSKPDEVYQAVKDAIDIGYRHFDCAYLYENEKEVGAALSEKIKEGAVKREELFIVTKLWNTDHKKELVVPALKRSLELLNLEYVDLYLIHWPLALKVECHPYFNQSKLIEFCSKNDITVTAYGPLGSPYRPLRPGATTLLEDPVVKTLSEEYKKSPAQILIKYQIQRNVVVIPKTVTKSRIASNFDVFDFTISPEDMELLNSLNKPDGRYVLLDDCVGHPDYPFNEEF
nr:1,5-anhydro-D-fructose reductase-like isoform X2 [Halyomorpha halys]